MAKKAFNPLESDAEALEAHIQELERRFDRLKNLYESFFSGIEKQAPSTARREMNRLMVAAQQISMSKATLRFRFQTLNQRWVTYIAYWNRTMREIESGTYRRDVAKARRKMEKQGVAMTAEQAIAMGVPANRAKAFVERQNRALAGRAPAAPEGPAAAKPPAPALPRVPGVTEPELMDFYRRYSQARTQTGDARPLRSLEELREKLGPQVERVLRESGAQRAALEVLVEDGRVKVRARPR